MFGHPSFHFPLNPSLASASAALTSNHHLPVASTTQTSAAVTANVASCSSHAHHQSSKSSIPKSQSASSLRDASHKQQQPTRPSTMTGSTHQALAFPALQLSPMLSKLHLTASSPPSSSPHTPTAAGGGAGAGGMPHHQFFPPTFPLNSSFGQQVLASRFPIAAAQSSAADLSTSKLGVGASRHPAMLNGIWPMSLASQAASASQKEPRLWTEKEVSVAEHPFSLFGNRNGSGIPSELNGHE